MATARKLRQEFCDKFAQHIVSVDHNVDDDFDQEFAFHAVCHPEIADDGSPKLPSDIEAYLKDKAGSYKTEWCGLHVHVHVEIDTDSLGIDDEQSDSTLSATTTYLVG